MPIKASVLEDVEEFNLKLIELKLKAISDKNPVMFIVKKTGERYQLIEPINKARAWYLASDGNVISKYKSQLRPVI
ncbi:MAG: hypothetical protein AAF378_10590 [Cyanobacteria bacterium P01_A01_bin.84]